MTSDTVPDSERSGLFGALPAGLRPYAALMRLDRPIGIWLLFWPCAWGLALAGGAGARWPLFGWFLLGAVAMRGAGCAWNDWVDREIDRSVARTRSRPMASGRVGARGAFGLIGALCLVGLAVLLQLRPFAAAAAIASLLPVAAYPYMKRITWWPQAWLGLVFSWGALVGWAAHMDELPRAAWLLYAGSVAWVVGYDTIYACQDVEDDALVGVRSSARRLGPYARAGVAWFYLLALALWAAALWTVRPSRLALLALLPVAAHLAWQVLTLRPKEGANALERFRSNRDAGALLFLGCLAVGSAG